MPSKESEFHEAALAEAQAAYDWYATPKGAAAEAFIGELDHAMEQIEMFPEAGTSCFRNASLRPEAVSFHGDLPRTGKNDSNCCCFPWSPKTRLLEKESQTLSGPRAGLANTGLQPPASRARILTNSK